MQTKKKKKHRSRNKIDLLLSGHSVEKIRKRGERATKKEEKMEIGLVTLEALSIPRLKKK